MRKTTIAPVVAAVTALSAGCASAPPPEPQREAGLSADERAAIRQDVYRDLLRPEQTPAVRRGPAVAAAKQSIAAAAADGDGREATSPPPTLPLVTTAFSQPPTVAEYLQVLAATSGYVLRDPGNVLAQHRRKLPVQEATATRRLDEAAGLISRIVPEVVVDVYPATRLLVVRETRR